MVVVQAAIVRHASYNESSARKPVENTDPSSTGRGDHPGPAGTSHRSGRDRAVHPGPAPGVLDAPPPVRRPGGRSHQRPRSHIPRMRAANTAALRALSTPTHATGTPGGICEIDSSASRPPATEVRLVSGTPITGRSV